MSIELWLAFVVAAAGLILFPGPTMLLVVGYAISSGVRPAFASMIGVVLGDIVAMTASFIGLGAMLAASALLFTGMKVVGAAYLVYLGVHLWRAPIIPAGHETDAAAARVPVRAMVWRAFAVSVLNVQSILFFAAFMPQFMDPREPALPQMLLIGGTFVALVLPVTAACILMSGRACRLFRTPRALRGFNRVGGGALIGAGALTAI